jgi:archaellum biogenesis ATPase FlaH
MAKIPEELQKMMLKKAGADVPDMSVSLDEIDGFGNIDDQKEMLLDVAKYGRMLKERITFINHSLTTVIPFTRENLYLICAYSGNGKSTVAANISYPLWQEDKKILIISNEESKQDVLFRISCLHLGLNFNDYKKGRMDVATIKTVMSLFPVISKYVKIKDVNYRDGFTTKSEGVKALLTAVQDADYSCVLIDYYQLIKYSTEDKSLDSYRVLDDLRIWLGQYIKRANLPVVLFAQLHSIGKRNNKDLDSRVKDCPTIIEPSTVVLEVIPDFENLASNFVIHKDRFGMAGKQIMCGFDKGRFIDGEAYEKAKLARLLGKEEEQEEETDASDQHEKVPDMQGGPEERQSTLASGCGD